MTNIGVGIAVISAGKILLTQREDFEVWCVPGGKLEDSESFAQAALREVKEETGLEVEIERLVGLYAIPQAPNGGSYSIVFASHPVGGTLCPDPREVTAVGWFGLDELPSPILPWSVQQAKDALSGVGGSAVWRQEFAWPFPPEVSWKDIYRLRDESGLSRQEFFLQHFNQAQFCQIFELDPGKNAGDKD